MNFKFYDILGHIIPGALIVTACIYFKISDDFLFVSNWSTRINCLKLGSVIPFIFLIVSYVLGYLISGLSSWSEKILWLIWGGRPSLILLKNSRQYSFWNIKIKRKQLSNLDKIESTLLPTISTCQKLNEITKNNISEIFQNIKYKALYDCSETHQEERLQNFFDSYLFARNLLVAIFLVFSILLYFNFSWELLVLAFIIMLILIKRCYDRAIYYSRELIEAALSFAKEE